jgi:plastocyanin
MRAPLTRALAALSIVALVGVVAACGDDDGDSATDDPAVEATTTTASSPGPGSQTTANGDDITIRNFSFAVKGPVKSGDAVQVRNADGTTHTVTSDDAGRFDVSVDGGKGGTFTAPAPGTYAFHCSIHSSMKGTLTVS